MPWSDDSNEKQNKDDEMSDTPLLLKMGKIGEQLLVVVSLQLEKPNRPFIWGSLIKVQRLEVTWRKTHYIVL